MICSSLNRLLRTTPPPALAGHGKWRSHIFNGLISGEQVSFENRTLYFQNSEFSGGNVTWLEKEFLSLNERVSFAKGAGGP